MAAHSKVGNDLCSMSKQQASGAKIATDGIQRNNIGANLASSDEPDMNNGLRELISSFGSCLQFEVEPEDELSVCYLNRLPEELFIIILQYLEPVYVERFALVCKKARMLTLDPNVWMCVHYTQS